MSEQLRTFDIEKLVLYPGGHSSLEEGCCVMEAVAFVAGEPWSDRPPWKQLPGAGGFPAGLE